MPMMRRPGGPPDSPESNVPAGQDPEGGLRVPSDTTPTWELEMLVSGAVLVGLFQVLQPVDQAWAELVPRLATRAASMAAGLAYSLLKGALYALLVTFVVHLASRAYWVALVGLDSVFPGGIRWERVSVRVLSLDEIKGMVRPLPSLISRLDNFCSVVFAVGFLAVAFALTALAFTAIGAGVVWLFSALFLPGRPIDVGRAITILWVLVFVPRVLYLLVWRLTGDSRATRWLRPLNRVWTGVVILRVFGGLSLTLMTNIRRRRVLVIVFVLLAGSFSVAFSQMVASRSGGDAVLYPGMPEALAGQATQYRYYADQRLGSDAYLALPFIQSDVVRDPYVRLFIPYLPRRDAAELQRCRAQRQPAQGASAIGNTGAVPTAADVALTCLAAIHAVALNGRPAAGLEYRFYTDAASGLEGILTYIPVADLPRGRNVLTVRRPAEPDADDPAAGSYSIPFWL